MITALEEEGKMLGDAILLSTCAWQAHPLQTVLSTFITLQLKEKQNNATSKVGWDLLFDWFIDQ